MQRPWWVSIVVAVAGCAPLTAVDCPDGFVITMNGTDCEPAPEPMRNEPDAGVIPSGATCEDLDCDDDNECTVDSCASAACAHDPAANGTPCALGEAAGVCESGDCVIDCSVGDCRPVYACTEDGVRDAIRDGGDVVIGCMEPTTVPVTEGRIEITSDVSLDGLGNLTLDAGGRSQVLLVHADVVAELIGVGITGGVSERLGSSGGINVRQDGTLTLRRSRVYGNLADEHAGGLGNSGTVSIIESEFTDNIAGERGGALSNNNEMTIIDSLIARNHARDDGGAIYNLSTGVVTIERSTFTGNVADDNGGAIWTSGTLVRIQDSHIRANVAQSGGGAIRVWTGAEVRVIGSTVVGNHVMNGPGGGIRSLLGLVSLEHAVLTQNSAVNGRGGAVYNDEDSILVVSDSTLSENAAAAGGGVYSLRATVEVQRSSVIDNVSATQGGGFRIFGHGPSEVDLLLQNCTVSGNQAGEVGGGIATASSAILEATHVTLSENQCVLGDELYQDRGAVSDVSHSVVNGGCVTTEDALLRSLGYNAVADLGPETCPLAGEPTDRALSAEEMGLGPLADNGGPTPTHLPNSTSFLIDAVPNDACDSNVAEDQRGEQRGNATPCDIGAVEVQQPD